MTVIITGTHFTGATAVSFGADIVVISFTVDSDTQITAIIRIPLTAALGARDVSVTTPWGTGTLVGGFTVTTPAVPRPPTVDTLAATDITGTGATLNGVLTNDEDWPCTVWFEWGATREYGMTTNKQFGMTTGDTFSADLVEQLTHGCGYHYRAVAAPSRYGSLVYGQDVFFTTQVQPHLASLLDGMLAQKIMEG